MLSSRAPGFLGAERLIEFVICEIMAFSVSLFTFSMGC